ncbi:hypothetical protein HGA92_00990 [Candidatus Gracilibacteria bacterium]|nr:hypothetical protein [Candidatus Gracilibacteria bacterium]NUJ98814.1 hypothetical protein [Candidatus Gracilibacteria bacterium]
MKKILTIISLLFVLASCSFNKAEQKIDETQTGAINLENNTETETQSGSEENTLFGTNTTTSSSSSSSEGGTGWRTLDPNCGINDIVVGTQTWAGCNSTLGTGFEWGKQDNGTNGTIGACYNYDGTNNIANCPIGGASMASNVSAITFFNAMQTDGITTYGDSEYDTIWGKLYTWTNAPSACPTGRHLPSDTEWTTLENYITTQNGDDANIGWMSHNTKTNTNNLSNALKIPLAGYRDTDGSTFYYRGFNTYLWSSTPSDVDAYSRHLGWYGSTVIHNFNTQSYGFSVRCMKD